MDDAEHTVGDDVDATPDPAPPRRAWGDLSQTEQVLMGAAIAVQVTLAAAAWIDLARRPPERVRGRRGFWAVAIAVNFVGPTSYFLIGRRR